MSERSAALRTVTIADVFLFFFVCFFINSVQGHHSTSPV